MNCLRKKMIRSTRKSVAIFKKKSLCLSMHYLYVYQCTIILPLSIVSAINHCLSYAFEYVLIMHNKVSQSVELI